MFAVIRVRGHVRRNQVINDTLQHLNLGHTNHCVLVPDNPTTKGMLQKVRNFITWGEASKEMEAALKKKQGDGKVARLSPPTKGYKSTKLAYPKGDLGYRGENINDLLKRMV